MTYRRTDRAVLTDRAALTKRSETGTKRGGSRSPAAHDATLRPASLSDALREGLRLLSREAADDIEWWVPGSALRGEVRGRLTARREGIQMWVALPENTRHGRPAFEHHAELPQADLDSEAGAATVLIGDFGSLTSPARHDTPLVGVELDPRAPVGSAASAKDATSFPWMFVNPPGSCSWAANPSPSPSSCGGTSSAAPTRRSTPRTPPGPARTTVSAAWRPPFPSSRPRPPRPPTGSGPGRADEHGRRQRPGVARQAFRALNETARAVHETTRAAGLDRPLVALVNIHVSRLNDCGCGAGSLSSTADAVAVARAAAETGIQTPPSRANQRMSRGTE